MKVIKKIFKRKNSGNNRSSSSCSQKSNSGGPKDAAATRGTAQSTVQGSQCDSSSNKNINKQPPSKDFTLPSDSVNSTGEIEVVTSYEMPEVDPISAAETSTKAAEEVEPDLLNLRSGETTSDEENPHLVKSYDAIPVLDQTKLPRGGLSVDTKAVGRVQFGIPPETIKDSMKLGIPVPQVYIVPVERFCREMGPALGVNLAEFEFPGYFNFFVYKKRCLLVVDSEDAEENIRRVFAETLLGPAQFRREDNPITHEEEDFSPEFPREAIPNFQKELQYFRIMPDGKELGIETLLSFCHFQSKCGGHGNLGTPPPLSDDEADSRVGDSTPGGTDFDTDEEEGEEVATLREVERREARKAKRWTYSQARFMGDVATIFPFDATEEQIKNRSVPRVEIFKMPGGTEYIVHDIDVNNHIIGKARLAGHVKVSESMSVDGFGGHSIMDDFPPIKKTKGSGKAKIVDELEEESMHTVPSPQPPPTFHPPSFGVTVLGNSHGFDASGSVSGYVLWINGRGVMIDPPPYSSATLEREGIRPKTIVGIILTHCHADHDAGAFQKVLTGTPVVVITTPTIYKSFIRKYAALSALSPALLRHSHRYKPAIIGQPLRFQGATFHFIYTLHTIPCVGFRVEWRGRSMVFTGDHFNSPPAIDKLQETGVLTKARADDLRHLPLQDTDVLLHEAGAPPIHTPLEVLLKLPSHVKKRLYVVHTSALPEGCELKVAPTGTAGTIRLDQPNGKLGEGTPLTRGTRDNVSSVSLATDEMIWTGGMSNEYQPISGDSLTSLRTFEFEQHNLMMSSFAHLAATPKKGKKARANSMYTDMGAPTPLVSLRPASSTDAWFILNLLSAVPFISSLSYASAMEVLETAKVDAYSQNDVIVPASKRSQILCVVWEGTCSERRSLVYNPRGNKALISLEEEFEDHAVWHAGDWTGPLSLQPDTRLSGECNHSDNFDLICVSTIGAKVITIEFSSLHAILRNGSHLYRKYLERKAHQERARRKSASVPHGAIKTNTTEQLLDEAMRNLNVLELLNCNSALRKLNAVQKRHLESVAEGPICFQPGDRLWRAGSPVDKAFLVISGTASFVPKRRNAGSSAVPASKEAESDKLGDPSVSDSMRFDAMKVIKEFGSKSNDPQFDELSMSSAEKEELQGSFQFDSLFGRSTRRDSEGFSESHDYDKLSRGLQKRADYLQKEGSITSENMSLASSHDDLDSIDTEPESQLDYTFTDEADPGTRSRRKSMIRRRSSRARFANKVLGRLYSRRAFTGGLIFSRGHFLGDVSKMVAGLLSTDTTSDIHDEYENSYGFGDSCEGKTTQDRLLESISDLVIHEREGDHRIMHSSTLTAGKDGCVVLVFPKASLIPFLDEYPGLLLSLLGTQVIV